ncbi:hypothetical protein GCM10011578_089180 [Streptomyces fuscichromogenes]|uniref:Uncharacterized protein n=1 Tax=Streptomyces fuscichromogenes TaxID=1324013 RepID=A0A917XNC9_9ACTN|nr:hypothetical protein GCM10011578_089180 [Streptomyces fuscichromogenes]
MSYEAPHWLGAPPCPTSAETSSHGGGAAGRRPSRPGRAFLPGPARGGGLGCRGLATALGTGLFDHGRPVVCAVSVSGKAWRLGSRIAAIWNPVTVAVSRAAPVHRAAPRASGTASASFWVLPTFFVAASWGRG